jgi:hypothetical protein
VTASFAESGGQTDVEVLTDLVITGKPAQFGRGVISDVSDKLLDQFVSCVSGRFGGATSTEPPRDEADTEQTIELEAVPAEEVPAEEVPAEEVPAEEVPAEEVPAEEVPAEEVVATAAAAVAASSPAESPGAPQPSPAYSAQPQGDSGESTLNVLSTVGPVLLKRYGPALAVVGLLIFVLIKIIRRKS